jgi:hypothetical protein
VKTPNKTLIGLATAAAVVGPMVPKTVTININEFERPAVVAEEKICVAVSMLIDDNGKRFCEYRCGKTIHLLPTDQTSCEKTIREKILKS